MTTNLSNTEQNQAALAALDRGLSHIEPGLWIAHRQRTLRAEACHMRSGINVAKSLSLGSVAITGGIGLLFGATGVGLIGGGLSVVTYIAVLVADKMDTDRFAPLPFIRTNLADRLETMGNAESREMRSHWEDAQRLAGHSNFEADEELFSNLPIELSDEAMMLTKHGGLVANMLSQLPTDKRDLAYLHLCNAHRTFGDAMTGLTLQRLTDQMEGNVGGNYLKMRPAEIHDYQPPAYQMGSGDRSFGELPAHRPLAVAPVTEPVQPADASTATLAALKQYIQQPKNLVVVASGGAGKGITLANLCRFRYEADTSFVAIWCDPKNDQRETGYFAHAGIKAFRFSVLQLTPEEVCQKMKDLLALFRWHCENLPEDAPVWLILDEWFYMLGYLKEHDEALLSELMNTITATISLMDGRHKHIVLVGQSPILKDILPGQGGIAANLNTLCLLKKDSSGVRIMEKAGQAGVMPRKDATAENLYAVADKSPRERAIYFGDRLHPVPELTNYSTYDRDRRTTNGTAPTVKNWADDPMPAITKPTEYHQGEIVPTAGTVEALNRAFESSPTPARPDVHDKVQRFADVVTAYFEKHPDKDSVGLSQIINSNSKLKKLRTDGRKDAIETLVTKAASAGLIQADNSDGGWSLSLPSDGFDFDF